jgi:ankyrin repeat protein
MEAGNDPAGNTCSPRVRLLGGILLGLNILAAVFGVKMLCWALVERGYQGEQWGLLGVLLFGGVGFPGLVVLLVLTILWMIRGRALALTYRLTVCVLIVAAILADLGALGCALYEPHRGRQAFERKSPVYQSGLREAVLDGDVDRAHQVLERNPSLATERDYYGEDALMLAVKAGDKPMVEMLLKNGAGATSHDFLDVTALHVAAKRGDVAIAKLLLDSGARVNAEDHDKKTPLAYARAAGDTAMVDLLSGSGGKDVDEETLLIRAVEGGDLPTATSLLDQGLSVNTCVPNGMQLLDFAAEKGHVEMARLLISRGALATHADQNGRTALHCASREGNPGMVAFLLDQGAKVDARDFEGMTPLLTAINGAQWHEPGSLKTIETLIERGANVNARNREGKSPLQYAGKYGTDSIRTCLREHGAVE